VHHFALRCDRVEGSSTKFNIDCTVYVCTNVNIVVERKFNGTD
jgi:hypothetical protein